MARDSGVIDFQGPFIGVRTDVHPALIGPSYCEDAHNVVFRRGRIERRKGFVNLMSLSTGPTEYFNKLGFVRNPVNGVETFLALVGDTIYGRKLYKCESLASSWTEVTAAAGGSGGNLPNERANFALFDDYVFLAGQQVGSRMFAFKLGDSTYTRAGLAASTEAPIIGTNAQGYSGIATPYNILLGSNPQYIVTYYDSTRNVESTGLETATFATVRARVTSTHASWPGVGSNITFTTAARPINERFDAGVLLKITSNSTPGTNYMYGEAQSDNGTSLVVKQIATPVVGGDPHGSPSGLTDLDITLSPLVANANQKIYFKTADPDGRADYVRIYRRESGESEYFRVAEKLISGLTTWPGDSSYKVYTDNVRSEDRDFALTAPLANSPPLGAEIVVNHNDIALFFNVYGKPSNRVYFSQPREIGEDGTSQTGAHYVRTDAYISLPFNPDDNKVTGAVSVDGGVVVFVAADAYAITGDFIIDDFGQANMSVRRLGINGCAAPNLCCAHKGIVFHADASGVYAYNGTDQKISEDISAVWKAINSASFGLSHMSAFSDDENKWLVIALAAHRNTGATGFSPSQIDYRPLYGNVQNGTSTTSLTVGVGTKAFTVAGATYQFNVGDRVELYDVGAAKRMIGDVTSVAGTTVVIQSKQSSGSGSSSSWNVYLYPPYPNIILVFNLDPPGAPSWGGGWTIWRERVDAVCAGVSAGYARSGGFLAAMRRIVHTTSPRTVLAFYGAVPNAAGGVSYLDLGAVGADLFAILGSPKISDLRHPVRFFDMTAVFEDQVGDGTSKLQIGFRHGRARHASATEPNGSPASVTASVYEMPLRLDAHNVRGWPYLLGTSNTSGFALLGYLLSAKAEGQK